VRLGWTRSCLALLFAAAPVAAQRPGLDVDVEGSFRPIPIAVPRPVVGESLRAPTDELVQVLRDDLEYSGYFDVVRPSLYNLVPASDASDLRHDDWLSIGADALVQLQIASDSDGRLLVTGRLYDNASKTNLYAQRYAGGTDLARRIAHQLANDLVRHYVGRDGVALTRIAFVSKHGSGKEVYLMDYDGARVRRLTTTGVINLSPVWSPDGNRMAFVSWRGRQPGIYVIDSEGNVSNLPVVEAELNAAPDWSPDGKQLVYASDRDGNSELYLLDVASGRNTRLTRSRAIETAPAFSPNGREIAFTSDRSGSPQVYVMDKDGLNVRRVSRTGGYSESPAWSPDGDKLAFVSRVEGRFEIFVLDIATDRLRQLTRGEGNNENPAWSPDGRHLVFASSRERGIYDLYTMRADGSDVRRLTRGGDCFTPDWSP